MQTLNQMKEYLPFIDHYCKSNETTMVVRKG